MMIHLTQQEIQEVITALRVTDAEYGLTPVGCELLDRMLGLVEDDESLF